MLGSLLCHVFLLEGLGFLTNPPLLEGKSRLLYALALGQLAYKPGKNRVTAPGSKPWLRAAGSPPRAVEFLPAFLKPMMPWVEPRPPLTISNSASVSTVGLGRHPGRSLWCLRPYRVYCCQYQENQERQNTLFSSHFNQTPTMQI